MILVYDNSFEGFMTCVFESFKFKNEANEIIAQKNFLQQSLFDATFITTDDNKAQRVAIGLKEKVSSGFFYDVYYLYLADTTDCGTIALQFVKEGLLYGKSVYNHNYTPAVNTALVLKNKVLLENHRLKGLARFKDINNILLANISPDHNILPILYKHFERRMPYEKWIIRDTSRCIAAVHLETNTVICDCAVDDVDIDAKDIYEDMWCAFYKSVAISQRTNPRLQQSYMPKRYWKNIIETKSC